LNLAPTATTITSGASLIPVLNLNPQGSTYRSDTFAFQGGKTGATAYMDLSINRVNCSVPIRYPRYTTAQRDALSVDAGWVLFNSTTAKLQCYDGTAWQDLF
jgi:hypothetical protein